MDASEKAYYSSFRQVVKAISSTLALQEVMDMMVENVTQVMDLKACAIRLRTLKPGALNSCLLVD